MSSQQPMVFLLESTKPNFFSLEFSSEMAEVALAAADLVASPVIEKIISVLEENYDSFRGMVDWLDALKCPLRRIDGAIKAVETRLIKNPSPVAWQRQAKDAVYRAQDVCDGLESKSLIHSVKSGNQVRAFNFAKRMVLGDDDFNNLKMLVKIIENLDRSIPELNRHMEENLGFRINKYSPYPQEMIGRNKETNVIISMLLSYKEEDGTSTTPSFVVVPIIGIGGVGKTTLAMHIFNNEKLLSHGKSQENHYPLSAWLDVHDSLNGKNVKNIASKLVSILSQNEETSKIVGRDNRYVYDGLEYNLKKLKNMTKDKRFLIVLDDVQDVDEDCWRQLKTVLACGAKGSSVLVTTQYQRVAKAMKTVEPVQLDLLNEGDYQKLLEQCAFSESILKEQLKRDLQSIATNISKTLQGLPLAGKALGEELSNERTLAKWNSILKSKWWEWRTVLGRVLPSLGLNYQKLKANQKRCFAYCSIFPKGYSFVGDRLVHMWMAQGFIHPNIGGEMSIEEIGRQIFTELVDRNFFQKISENAYIMPDVIRELAVYLSLDDSFVVNDETEIGKIPSSVYHLTVNSSKLDVFTGISFKKLRTILFFGKYETKEFYKVLKDILSCSKSLRMLDLSHTGTEIQKLPEAICDLSHLRYLDISNTKIRILPKLFCKLCHLQVLNLQHCHFNGLPEGMNKLISLRHLCAESKTVSLISGIGKLTCLQELKEFHVRKEKGHKIGELKNLKNLQGQLLIQNLENVDSKEEAMNAKLKEKKCLDALWLYFEIRDGTEIESSFIPRTMVEVLEGLEPCCDIKELGIKGYHGDIFPSWLVNTERFAWLTSIHLCSCDLLTILPPLGQLPLLSALHIETMPALRKIGVELYGKDDEVFPSLEDLTLKDLRECEEWSEVEGRRLFPRLRRLHIEQCMKLRELTILRLNLPVAELKINSCGDLGSSLTECLQRFTLLTLLEISNYQHMASLSLCNLAALEDLCLLNCPMLRLQEDLRSLTNLKQLKIIGCPMLCNSLKPQQPHEMRGLQSQLSTYGS